MNASTTHDDVEPMPHRWGPVIVVGAVLLGLAYWAVHWQLGDDPHITFVYSRNIADGLGFVFNVGDRTLSTTTPLMALLLTVPSLVGADVATVGIVLAIVSTGVIAALLYIDLRPLVGTAGALAVLPMATIQPFFLTTATNEVLPYIALAVVSFHLLARRRDVWAMLAAALCALMRPDGGLVVVMVATIIVWHGWRSRRPASGVGASCASIWAAAKWPAAVAVATVLPWIVFATWYFGSPIPVTLEAKQAQRDLGLGRSWVTLLHDRFAIFVDEWRFLAIGILAVTGAVVVVSVLVGRCRRPVTARGAIDEQADVQRWTIVYLLSWNLLYVLAFLLLDVNAYGWYVAPLGVALAICVAHAVGWLADLAGGSVPAPAATALVGVVAVVAVVVPLVDYAIDVHAQPPNRTALYPDVGRWISVHVPPEASVGTLEVGLIGYYAHRTIIDFAGLLQPDVIVDAPPDDGYDGAALLAWNRYDPDFVAMLSPGFPSLRNDPRFQSSCRIVKTFSRPDVVPTMDIWDCLARPDG